MSTINGIGTKMYGTVKRYDDGSYDTVEWFVILYIPLWPVAAYRIYYKVPVKDHNPNPFSTKSIYSMKEIPIPWKYVLKCVGITVGCIALISVLNALDF